MSSHHLKERMAEQDRSSNNVPHAYSMKQQTMMGHGHWWTPYGKKVVAISKASVDPILRTNQNWSVSPTSWMNSWWN